MKFLFVILCTVVEACAANLSGVWTGTVEFRGPDGVQHKEPLFLSLKWDGTVLTGVSGPNARENGPIRNGQVRENQITFEQTSPSGATGSFRLKVEENGRITGFIVVGAPVNLTGAVDLKSDPKGSAEGAPAKSAVEIHPYDDVRGFLRMAPQKDPSGSDLSGFGDGLATLTFNQRTAWPAAGKMPKSPTPAELIELAMNPGLGIRELHRRGITGKGVAVAIIDQPLYRDNPEFAGKIVAYEDAGCKSESSMHGPAVASLLAGNRMGAAPGVKIYYVAAPSWLADAAYYAKALDWILAQNRKLPKAERIRVVSVSAAPSGKGSPFTKNGPMWDEAVARAEAEGIVVLDCSEEHGVIGSCWFRGQDRNVRGSCVPGFPGMPVRGGRDRVLAPTSSRTVAEEYQEGDFGYTYCGRGGLSWAIPYAAGVMALRWQLHPEMTAREAVDLLRRTADRVEGGMVIDPEKFVNAK